MAKMAWMVDGTGTETKVEFPEYFEVAMPEVRPRETEKDFMTEGEKAIVFGG